MINMSKSIFYVFVLTLMSMFNFACKKDPVPTTPDNLSFVEGRVYDFLTNEPIAGAQVELWEDDVGGDNRLSEWDRKLGTGITDASGRYKIPFEGCSNYMKAKGILARKENYFTWDNPDLLLINCGNDFQTDFSLVPSSWIKLNIQNVNPVNVNDSIFLSLTGPLELLGTQVDTTLFFELQSNDNLYFYWDVTKNGQTAPRSGGYVFCSTAFDTCSFDIHY